MKLILTLICIILFIIIIRQVKEYRLRRNLRRYATDEEIKQLEEAADEDLLNNGNFISRRNKDIVAEEAMYRCLKNHCVDYWLTVKQNDND